MEAPKFLHWLGEPQPTEFVMNDTGPPLTLQDRAPAKNRMADISHLTIIFADQRDVIYRARYIGDDGGLMLTNQVTRSYRRATAADMQRPLSVIGAVFKS